MQHYSPHSNTELLHHIETAYPVNQSTGVTLLESNALFSPKLRVLIIVVSS